MTIQFEITALPKLPNAGLRGSHWAVEARYRKQWHWLVRAALGKRRPRVPLQRARVTLIRRSAREPDPDGLMASWKPVLDGLVRAGVLVDDTASHVALYSRWEKAPRGNGHIEVAVEEMMDVITLQLRHEGGNP